VGGGGVIFGVVVSGCGFGCNVWRVAFHEVLQRVHLYLYWVLSCAGSPPLFWVVGWLSLSSVQGVRLFSGFIHFGHGGSGEGVYVELGLVFGVRVGFFCGEGGGVGVGGAICWGGVRLGVGMYIGSVVFVRRVVVLGSVGFGLGLLWGGSSLVCCGWVVLVCCEVGVSWPEAWGCGGVGSVVWGGACVGWVVVWGGVAVMCEGCGWSCGVCHSMCMCCLRGSVAMAVTDVSTGRGGVLGVCRGVSVSVIVWRGCVSLMILMVRFLMSSVDFDVVVVPLSVWSAVYGWWWLLILLLFIPLRRVRRVWECGDDIWILEGVVALVMVCGRWLRL
jgi:hypothetical protein